MKRLILIRHIKSSWSDPPIRDFDRTIQQERIGDALLIADYLKSKKICPDLMIASTAKRTQQTVALFAAHFEIDIAKITSDKSLYESTKWEIHDAVRNADPAAETVLIICHNPSITDFANQVSTPFIANMSTCGCISLLLDEEGKWEREFYVSPKMLR